MLDFLSENPQFRLIPVIATFAILVLFILIKMRDKRKTPKEIQCPNCKYEGNGKWAKPGNGWITFVLILSFVIPGFLYAIWRATNQQWQCPRCRFRNVVVVA